MGPLALHRIGSRLVFAMPLPAEEQRIERRKKSKILTRPRHPAIKQRTTGMSPTIATRWFMILSSSRSFSTCARQSSCFLRACSAGFTVCPNPPPSRPMLLFTPDLLELIVAVSPVLWNPHALGQNCKIGARVQEDRQPDLASLRELLVALLQLRRAPSTSASRSETPRPDCKPRKPWPKTPPGPPTSASRPAALQHPLATSGAAQHA